MRFFRICNSSQNTNSRGIKSHHNFLFISQIRMAQPRRNSNFLRYVAPYKALKLHLSLDGLAVVYVDSTYARCRTFTA